MNTQTQNSQPDSDWEGAAGFGTSEQLASTSNRGQAQRSDPLRSEALTDFQQLEGWWNKIIVRDMLKSDPESLPRILLM